MQPGTKIGLVVLAVLSTALMGLSFASYGRLMAAQESPRLQGGETHTLVQPKRIGAELQGVAMGGGDLIVWELPAGVQCYGRTGNAAALACVATIHP